VKTHLHRRRQYGGRSDRAASSVRATRQPASAWSSFRPRRAHGSPRSSASPAWTAWPAAATLGQVVVLAVKPQQMRAAAQALGARLGQELVITIAAGIRLVDLSRWLGGYARPGALHAEYAGAHRRRHQRSVRGRSGQVAEQRANAEAILGAGRCDAVGAGGKPA